MKFSTGGYSPRAFWHDFCEIQKPTVKVWMKEEDIFSCSFLYPDLLLVLLKGRTMINQNKRKIKKNNASYLSKIAIMSALAFILMQFEITLPIFPSFLKIGISDLPALIVGFSLGPLAAFLTELIKNLLDLPLSKTGGIGQLANLLTGLSLVLPASILYRRRKSFKNAIFSLGLSTIFAVITSAFIAYFITIPLYSKFMPIEKIIEISSKIIPAVNSKFNLILYTFVPFNILKCIIVSILCIFIYKRISFFLKSKEN